MGEQGRKPFFPSQSRPKVGVAVFVTSAERPNCVLLGFRKGSIGAGTLAPPGGHLEFGEQFEECGRREVLEETGLRLSSVNFEHTVNVVWPQENYHYIDIVLKAELDAGYQAQPVNMEPDKCAGWEWYDWDNLPPREQLFEPFNAIRESGYHPFAAEKL